MVSFFCDPQDLQQVKDSLRKKPANLGIGILHEPTGQIYLSPFDKSIGGHSGLASSSNLPQSECKGFVIVLQPDGSFTPVNLSHLNGSQGQPGSLKMPEDVFDSIVQALENAGL